jgi:predicted Fe-Mo cluster-binding NifX family protein
VSLMEKKLTRIAVATVGDMGLEDAISPEFGYSRTFTIIDVENGEIKNVEVMENPAGNIAHGRGPIIGKCLADKDVEIVVTSEIGPGASAILEQLGIKVMMGKAGQKVEDVLREYKLVRQV